MFFISKPKRLYETNTKDLGGYMLKNTKEFPSLGGYM